MCSDTHARQALASLDLVEGLAAKEIHARLVRCLRLEDVGQRGLAFYLHELKENEHHQHWGCKDVTDYAQAHLDLDPRRTRELIAAEEKLRHLPRIETAFAAHAISWTKVLMLLRVAGPEHEAAWVEKAVGLGCKQLRGEILRARPGGPPRDPRDTKGVPEIRFRQSLTLGTVAYEKQQLALQKLSDELGRAVTAGELQELLLGMYLTMEKDGEVPGWKRVPSSLYRILLRPLILDTDGSLPLFVETEQGPLPIDGTEVDDVIARTRSACAACDGEMLPDDDDMTEGGTGSGRRAHDLPTPPALRLRALKRDRNRCRCCGGGGELHVHHITFRSDGGRTKLHNLISICVRCHALIHAGLLGIQGLTQKKARFTDREGRSVHSPGETVDPALLLQIAEPVRALPVGERADVDVDVERTTLDTLPEVVDGRWWQRNADLLRCRSDRGLELREGRPAPEPEPEREPEPSEEVEGADEGLPDAAQVPFDEAFAGIVGQEMCLERLRIEAEGSLAMGATFAHTLLTGPPGTGKTTLARGVAACRGARLVPASGPLLRDVHALIGLLVSLRDGDVLFLDEIHAMGRGVLEVLYEAMAEGRLTLTFRVGARSRSVRLDLARFTLLAATTEPDELPRALVSRFALREHLGFYEEEDLAILVARRARERGFVVQAEAASSIARNARGTPREALRLLERVLRHGARSEAWVIDAGLAAEALRCLGYDDQGLVPEERRYLGLLARSRDPIPLRRLAAMLGLSIRTLLEEIEPWLCRLGLVRVTSRGRIAARNLSNFGENMGYAIQLA